jgi:type II secretory pathway pseudopilin PulG
MRNERLEPAPSDAPADAVGKSTPSAETIEALEALMRSTSDPEGADLPNLRDVSDPEERDRLLAAALAYAEMQEARYRVSADTGAGRRLKGSLATVLFLLALLILARPPTLLVPAALPVASEAEQLRGARIALLLQAQQIEAFRSRENRLPESLAELDNPLPDVRVVVALLSVVAALLRPVMQRRAYERLETDLMNRVEILRTAATLAVLRDGSWPAPTQAGRAPNELSSVIEDNLMTGEAFTVQWHRWEVTEPAEDRQDPAVQNLDELPAETETPRIVLRPWSVGGIVVRSGRPELLTALLSAYGPTVSFVRDSTWTLVVDRAADPTTRSVP